MGGNKGGNCGHGGGRAGIMTGGCGNARALVGTPAGNVGGDIGEDGRIGGGAAPSVATCWRICDALDGRIS